MPNELPDATYHVGAGHICFTLVSKKAREWWRQGKIACAWYYQGLPSTPAIPELEWDYVTMEREAGERLVFEMRRLGFVLEK